MHVATAYILVVSAAAQGLSPQARIISELRGHQPEAALRDAELALKTSPGDPRLWVLKGLAARATSQTGIAVEAFRQALQMKPDYVPALEGITELLYREQPQAVRPYLTRLLRQRPEEPTANAMQAMIEAHAGKFADAAESFRRAMPVIANQQLAMSTYAETLARLRRDSEARNLFATIAERWPEDVQARFNLAVLDAAAGDKADALAALDPLVRANDEPALSLAASLHEAQGDTPAAVELYRVAIAANPKDPQNYIDFGALSFDHNSAQAGIAILNTGLQQLPGTAALYIARGILHMQVSEVEAADRDFARANQIDPSQSFGMEAQGLSEMQRHDLPAALAKVKSSLAKSPDNAYLNYLAALILREQGAVPGSREAAEALEYAHRATKLDPNLTPAQNLTGAFAFAAGNMPLAAQASRAVLQRSPEDQEAVFRLILALRRMGDSQHEVARLVERLKTLRAHEHTEQQKVDHYRLSMVPPV
jgi:tetratricopeptide (TPR) repeat protein